MAFGSYHFKDFPARCALPYRPFFTPFFDRFCVFSFFAEGVSKENEREKKWTVGEDFSYFWLNFVWSIWMHWYRVVSRGLGMEKMTDMDGSVDRTPSTWTEKEDCDNCLELA